MVDIIKKIRFPVLFILLFAFFVRILWLDLVPNAFSGDELTYVVTAKVMQLTGSDISGSWHPYQAALFKYPIGEHQAEIPYFLLLPFIYIFGNSFFFIRLPFALMGTLVVLLIYLVTRRMLGEKIGFTALLLASVNPWFIFMSRTTYEMIPATLFYLLSLFFMLDKNTKRTLYAIPFLILAFYSYIGTKLILLPYILIIILFKYFTSTPRKFSKPYAYLLGTGLFLVLLFVVMQTGNNTRMGDLFLPGDSSIQQAVDSTRKATIQNPLLPIVVNKGTVYIESLIGKTLSVISPTFLFFEGDLFFSLWHGFLYPIDLIFILSGIVFLMMRKRHIGFLMVSLLVLSIVPQVFHKNTANFSSHITLLVPFLIIISSVGIVEMVNLCRGHLLKRFILILIFFCYSLFILNFFHTYFYIYPLNGQTEFDVRVLSNYLNRAKKEDIHITVLSAKYADLYKKYLFYTNSYQKNSIETIRKSFNSKNYIFDKITFLPCESPIVPSQPNDIIIIDSECKNENNTGLFINIPKLKDGGSVYKIYNDTLCNVYGLKTYPIGIQLRDFAVESRSPKEFCETFITKFN